MRNRSFTTLAVSMMMLIIACESDTELLLLPGDMIVLSDLSAITTISVQDDGGVTVTTDGGESSCDSDGEFVQTWHVVSRYCDLGLSEVRHEREVDPNHAMDGTIVACLTRRDSNDYMVRYVVGADALISAGQALDKMFSGCGLERSVRMQFVQPPN